MLLGIVLLLLQAFPSNSSGIQPSTAADSKQLKQHEPGRVLTGLLHKKGKGVRAEQVVPGGEEGGVQRGDAGSRSSRVSGFHKAGLSQLNGSGMTFQVQRRLCNKHSNRGLASGHIIERCS